MSQLSRRIGDSSTEVSRASIRALARICNDQAVEALLVSLASNQPHIRILAYDMLKSLPTSRIMQQFSWKRKETAYTKVLKSRLLTHIATESAFWLLQHLADDNNEAVRTQFVRCLSAFSTNLTHSLLSKYCRDESALVRKAVLGIISQKNIISLKPDVESLCNDSDRAVHWLALRIIRTWGIKTTTSESMEIDTTFIEPKLESSTKNDIIYQNEEELTRKILSYPAVKKLPAGAISALTSQDSEVRSCALQTLEYWSSLSKNYDEKTGDNLVHSLQADSDYDVQIAALLAFKSLRGHKVAREMFENNAIKIIADRRVDPLLRVAAIRNLEMDDETVSKLLARTLKDEVWIIRYETIKKLFQVRKTSIYKKMARVLRTHVGDILILTIIDLERLRAMFASLKPVYIFDSKDETRECKDILEELIRNLREKTIRDKLGIGMI